MSKQPAERTFVLFKTDTAGPDLAQVATKVRSDPKVTLVGEGGSALLVQGPAANVRQLTADLTGWRAEANTAVK